jgi:hypothetical protein
MKNAVFWDVTPCDSCKNRRTGFNIPEDGILFTFKSLKTIVTDHPRVFKDKSSTTIPVTGRGST